MTEFFFDRDIGTAVPRALQIVRQAFEDVHFHDELFARRARFGWDYWGDESLGTAQLPEAL